MQVRRSKQQLKGVTPSFLFSYTMKLHLAIIVCTSAFAVAESRPGQSGYSGGGRAGGASPFSSGGDGASFGLGNGGYPAGNNNFGNSGSGYPSPNSNFNGGNSGSPSYSAPQTSNSYNAPSSQGLSNPSSGYNAPSGYPDSEADQGPQTFKYVSIHTAPASGDDEAVRTVKVPGGNNKHVNIIFVKAPSNGADQKTEVVLPDPDEHKSLVYVLVQKSDAGANIKVRRPPPKPKSKPEVYFIRYKNKTDDPSSAYGAPSGPSSNYGAPGGPSSNYGAPSGPSPVFRSGSNVSPSYGAP